MRTYGSSLLDGVRRRPRRILAAAVVGVGLGASILHADVTATWIGNIGNWVTAADWSTNPNYPNNGTPSGVDYQVVVAQTSSIVASKALSVDGLTINSSNAEVEAGPNTFTVGNLNVIAGEFAEGDGTLAAANSSTIFSVGSQGTLALNSGTISGGTLSSSGSVTLNGSTLNGVTIAAGTTVDVTGTSVASELSLTGNWLNSGTISGNNTALGLGGSFSLSNLGTVNLTGNYEFAINGNLNNTGNTLTFSQYPGNWQLTPSGTITGGILSPSSSVTFTVYGGTLNGVQLGTNLNLNSSNVALTAINGLTGTGAGQTINLNGSTFSTFVFGGGNQTVDNIAINGNVNTNANIAIGNSASGGSVTATLGPEATLEGSLSVYNGSLTSTSTNAGTLINNGTISCSAIQFYNAGLINNGTIQANGGVFNVEPQVLSFTNNNVATTSGGYLFINAQTWTNAAGASIIASNNGELSLTHTWTNAANISATNSILDIEGTCTNLGTIAATNSQVIVGGTQSLSGLGNFNTTNCSISLSGTLNLQNGTLNLPASDTATLAGSTINNGTIDCNGTPLIANSTNTLSNVTISGGPLNMVNGSLDVLNGFTVSSQVIDAVGASSLSFDGSNPTADNLNITTTGSRFAILAGGPNAPSTDTLTLGKNFVVNGAVEFADNSGITGTIINNGTINGTSNVVFLFSTQFVNNGTISISSGAELEISNDTAFTNNGAIRLLYTTSISNITAPNGLNIGNGTLVGSGEIAGNLDLLAGGSSLDLSIGGTTQFSGYNSIAVDGNIQLGGDLLLDFTQDFQSLITSSETFVVLENASGGEEMTGSFDNVISGARLETTDGFGSFEVTYGPVLVFGHDINEVVLSDYQPIPEPGSLGLMAGSLFLASRRRRPRKAAAI